MASGGERGLAKKLLSQRGSGSVSNDLAASARRVLDGQARAGDMDAIRAHFNVGRSYAGKIRGVTGAVSRIGSLAANVGRDIDLMSTGSAAASARLTVNVAQAAASEIVRNRRTLIKIGEGIAQTVGADPALASRFFNSLSRVAKLGGALAGVAMLGYEVASGITSTMKAAAEAGTRVRQQADAFMNRSTAVGLMNRASSQADSEMILGTLGGSGGTLETVNPLAWYNDWVDSRREKNRDDKLSQELKRAKANREMVRNQAGAAIARLAAEKGVAVGDLETQDVNLVLDNLASRRIGYTAAEYLQHAHNRYGEMSIDERVMFHTFEASKRARQNMWEAELNDRTTEFYGNRIEARAAAEIETRRAMSSTDRLALLQARDEAAAGFSSYRSRHKAVILD